MNVLRLVSNIGSRISSSVSQAKGALDRRVEKSALAVFGFGVFCLVGALVGGLSGIPAGVWEHHFAATLEGVGATVLVVGVASAIIGGKELKKQGKW